MALTHQLQLTVDRFFRIFGHTNEAIDHHSKTTNQVTQDLRETTLDLLEVLGAVVDAYNAYTRYHSAQVAQYSNALAKAMGLPEVECERIFKAALVHDVGMISVPGAIIARPGPLTDGEFEQLKMHATIGGEILGRMKNMKDLVPMVHYHHERYDGCGYPDRLKGEEIPLGARILAVADSLDVMLSGRPYSPARSLPEVVEEIKSCSGLQFDPMVVKAFLHVLEEKDGSFFTSASQKVSRDMLLSTLGVSSGRAMQLMGK